MLNGTRKKGTEESGGGAGWFGSVGKHSST